MDDGTTCTVEARHIAPQTQRRTIQTVRIPSAGINKRTHTRAEKTGATHQDPLRTASIRCAEEAPRAELLLLLLLLLLVDPLPSPAPLARLRLGLKVALRPHAAVARDYVIWRKTKPEWPH